MLRMKKPTANHVFIILLTIVGILLIIRYSNHSSKNLSQNAAHTTTFTTTPSPLPTITTDVSPRIISNTPSDIAVKNALLIRLLHGTNQSGIVYSSQNVQVQYIASDLIFQAEILTPAITAAKSETEIWFQEQGISHNGLCKLLFFYVNPAIKANLTPSEAQVSLLPDGC